MLSISYLCIIPLFILTEIIRQGGFCPLSFFASLILFFYLRSTSIKFEGFSKGPGIIPPLFATWSQKAACRGGNFWYCFFLSSDSFTSLSMSCIFVFYFFQIHRLKNATSSHKLWVTRTEFRALCLRTGQKLKKSCLNIQKSYNLGKTFRLPILALLQ